jgi:hypothetical protein
LKAKANTVQAAQQGSGGGGGGGGGGGNGQFRRRPTSAAPLRPTSPDRGKLEHSPSQNDLDKKSRYEHAARLQARRQEAADNTEVSLSREEERLAWRRKRWGEGYSTAEILSWTAGKDRGALRKLATEQFGHSGLTDRQTFLAQPLGAQEKALATMSKPVKGLHGYARAISEERAGVGRDHGPDGSVNVVKKEGSDTPRISVSTVPKGRTDTPAFSITM